MNPPVGGAAPAPIPDVGQALEAEVASWVREYASGSADSGNSPDARASQDRRFNDLAQRIYRYQASHNPSYARFCARQGRTLPAGGDTADFTAATASNWLEIPALPASALKETAFTTFDPERAAAVFETSGTTQGRPGRHYMRDTSLYEEALCAHFHHFVLPDRAREPGGRLPILVLFPDLPNSSLSHMMRTVIHRFGAVQSAFFLHNGVDEDALDSEGLAASLGQAAAGEQPVLLMGAVLGFVFAMEALAARGQSFRLPPGSRIMDTGGFKGRRREVARSELLARYEACFGITADFVVNEYGMTELGSQLYDTTLRLALRGEPLTADAGSEASTAGPGAAVRTTGLGAGTDTRLVPPPWLRMAAVDPATLRPLPPGERGLLRVCDLANVHSVACMQLEDVGRVDALGRVDLEGRAQGAELRGCSLSVEDLFQAPLSETSTEE